MLDISLDLRGLNRIVDRLTDTQMAAAQARALNRGRNSARTVMVRATARDLGLVQREVRDRIYLRDAKPGHLEAALVPSRTRLPLILFSARGHEPSRGRGRTTAKVGRTRKKYPHAFIATMRSGHRGVFRHVPGGARRGDGVSRSQLPIFELRGPSVARAFRSHRAEGAARGREQVIKNLRSEIRHRLRTR